METPLERLRGAQSISWGRLGWVGRSIIQVSTSHRRKLYKFMLRIKVTIQYAYFSYRQNCYLPRDRKNSTLIDKFFFKFFQENEGQTFLSDSYSARSTSSKSQKTSIAHETPCIVYSVYAMNPNVERISKFY